MEQGTNKIKDEDESTSNNEEESSKNSSVQVLRSSVKEKVMSANKVEVFIDSYSIDNNEIIDESIDTIHNNVQNKASNTGDNLSVDISDNDEQNHTSNLNEQRNYNSIVKDKGTDSDINVDFNVPPADQYELSSQSDQEYSDQETENIENQRELFEGDDSILSKNQ